VVLTHIDGEQSDDEAELDPRTSARTCASRPPRATQIVAAAEARVKRLLASQA
jgi:hypothetical protein